MQTIKFSHMSGVVAVESLAMNTRVHRLFESCLVDPGKELRETTWNALLSYSDRVKDDETIKSLSNTVLIAMKVRFFYII